jgi:GIY-YIG catalytic domain
MSDERQGEYDSAAMALFDDETAEKVIRRVMHEGRWFFSVIDVVGALTDALKPRLYWADMKRRIQDEGFSEMLNRCQQIKIAATDGKLRETDCADFMTMTALIQYLPVIHRREPTIASMGVGVCGVYSIHNGITQNEYIGSSINIAQRFAQHRALLRRGKHHADKLQDAWNTFGESAFSLIILGEVTDPAGLTTEEQRYLDERQPGGRFVTHGSSLSQV